MAVHDDELTAERARRVEEVETERNRTAAAIEEATAQLADDPLGTLASRGGLTWYGGFVLATLLLIVYARSRGIPVLRALDAMAPALALGYAIGRVGCYLVGDDYGQAASVPWAVAFPDGAPPGVRRRAILPARR